MNSKIMTKNAAYWQFAPNGLLLPILLSLLLLVLGGGKVWAQTDDPDYSGYYYIANCNGYNSGTPNDNFYLCPAQNPDNNNQVDNYAEGQPYLTTYKTNKVLYSIWQVIKTNDNYYQIIHYNDNNRQITNNGQVTDFGANRLRVHLEANPSDANDTKFVLQKITNDYFIIYHKDIDINNDNTKNWSLNPPGGNKNSYVGDGKMENKKNIGGLLGYYSYTVSDGIGSRWRFEDAQCVAPVIQYDPETTKLTITSETDGATIYYTIGDTTPTTGSSVYSDSDKPTITERTIVKAIASKTNMVNSEVTTQTIVLDPIINVASATYNGEEQKPAVNVFDGENEIPAEEYEVSYSNNLNAGENAIVTIIDKEGGDYIVYGATTFTIEKATITPTVSIVGWSYGETPNEPTVKGNICNGAVTYKYKASDAETYSETVPTEVGTYMIKAIIAETTNTLNAEAVPFEFAISPKSIGDGKKAAEGFVVNMKEESSTLVVTVKYGDTTLEEEDYTVAQEEQDDDILITVTGIGNYTGSVTGVYVKPVFTRPADAADGDPFAAVYQAKSDYSNPTGITITPYIVRGVNPLIGTLTISPLAYIPKDVPVLMLTTNAETKGFIASDKPEESEDGISQISAGTKNSNQLKVSDGTVEVSDAQVYMFYMGEFVLTKAGTLSAGKFYIYNPNYTAMPKAEEQQGGGGESRSVLRFVIEDATGINVNTLGDSVEKKKGNWYTLDGRRLTGKPIRKGLYISNGHKVVIK